MSRRLDELTSGDTWPAPGWVRCRCVGVARPQKDGKPVVHVSWEHADGVFWDRLYLTPKALKRVATFVSRLCPGDIEELPDDDDAALEVLADQIVGHADGIEADVEIVERPDREGVLRRQVSFAGYRAAAATAASRQQTTDDPPPADTGADPAAAEDDLPF